MRIGIVITSQKNFLEEGMKNPREIFEGLVRFTRREGGIGRAASEFFPGFYYRVAGGGYFTTFLKQNFENLICDGKLN